VVQKSSFKIQVWRIFSHNHLAQRVFFTVPKSNGQRQMLKLGDSLSLKSKQHAFCSRGYDFVQVTDFMTEITATEFSTNT